MVNYQNIADSIEFYENWNYKRIETPWTVTEAISNLTKPGDKIDWKIHNKNKVLVGSAEQGFLYLILKGFLPPGKYQSVGPCFREESFDLIHTKYFIKNELILTDDPTEANLKHMLTRSKLFFASILKINEHVLNEGKTLYVKQTGDLSYDIEYKGIELGSYGIRENDLCKYIYGTGCAEPRLSYCQNLK